MVAGLLTASAAIMQELKAGGIGPGRSLSDWVIRHGGDDIYLTMKSVWRLRDEFFPPGSKTAQPLQD